ncbi:PREDICTED: carotenoid isomerooxygenase isoform X2 [Wasmannia auropunctata]|uniref:carotenoid isomerooxygenase isoform X2 n=1 Tax=Wasmannia auropunctata TaxID=64793 RepID=UPI0005EEE112|nr:PREDICTED: carotenoid isomerooxygenase isoform X2 [Wasmannia auropunctata]XP_011701873.1 PREDICTED: carotenoid isomerooxygenase isoform X2 [Wasmannia auropunctata]XP_011701874.1 PREDICTED: carotenoid isomerooxygenase isoform X2 [Wasmannia auropunctata]
MFTSYRKKKIAKPPPSWYDIEDLFPHDENENDTSTDAAGNYYANCNTSVWMRSCEKEVIEPLQATEITGTVPKWLKGVLLRNGPGNLKVGKYRYQHLFDSSALLHRFGIADGEITYQRRFIQTDVYKRNMAAQRIVYSEFGTNATPDPCQTIFHRVAAVFNPNGTLSDNSMISVYPFGDEYYTFTEAPVMHRIDPKNLETMGKINMPKYVNIVNHTSHPHVMNDSTVYNVGLSITSTGPRYSVVRFSPNRVIVDGSGKEKELSMFDQATIVASVPSRWLLNPSYMHTFGITENFFIIVEQPLSVSFFKMAKSHYKQEAMMNSFKWHENESTLIHVISRQTGQVVRTFVAETFFYLHIINQFETRDKNYVVLDVCCYRNPKMLECMYIDAMKNMHGNIDYSRLFRARPLRFVLPMRKPSPETPLEHNLVMINTVHQTIETSRDINGESIDRRPNDVNGNADDIEYDDKANFWRNKHRSALQKKPVAHRLHDGKIFVKPELLCDVGCETPRINTDFHLGKEYRYFYAISCDMDLNNPGTLIKVDIYQKTKKMWQEDGIYPSEPIFVPNPDGKNEDDGVVVSSLVWTNEETRVGLLILDAVTFTEIARATFETPGPVPKCLHGWFSLNKL